MEKMKLVMVGNGMAGVRTLEELLKIAPDLYDMTVFGAEPPRQSRRPTIDHQAVAKILAAASGIRDELHAIATVTGQGASAVAFEEALRALTEIRAACFQALGRKP